jgi:hypothetical protein
LTDVYDGVVPLFHKLFLNRVEKFGPSEGVSAATEHKVIQWSDNHPPRNRNSD